MKTIICSAQPFFLDLVHRLRDSCGVVPVYWFTSPSVVVDIRARFPGVITHDYYAVIKGRPAPEFADRDFGSLDWDLVEALREHEPIIIEMMNRNDAVYNRFTYNERLDVYYGFLRYWSMVLDECEVEAVIFEEEPHQASDFILYLVAKHRRVRTLFQIRTISKLGMIPSSDIFETSPLLLREYDRLVNPASRGECALPQSLQSYFDLITSDYKSILKEHLFDQVEAVENLGGRRLGSLTQALGEVRRMLTLRLVNARVQILMLLGLRPFESDQKVPSRSFEESRLDYLRFLLFRIKLHFIKKNNLKRYRALSAKGLDLSGKFIFVGLQFQPEKSTCPLAGRFVHQLLILETLLKHLPDDWTIVVKEHPSQFVESYSRYGDQYRAAPFYDRLAAMPRMQIAPIDAVPFDLIDRAQAVASAGGTLCWEAICRGKPALTFAHCWFQSCHGVHHIRREEDVLAAMKRIQAGEQVDVELVRLFALAVHNLDVPGAVGGPHNLEFIGVTPAENAENIARGLAKLVESLKAGDVTNGVVT